MTLFYAPQPKWQLQKERLKAKQLKASKWWQWKLKKGQCYYCGKHFTAKHLTMDHKVPLAKGGLSSKSNVVVACHKCNTEKGTRTSVDVALCHIQKK